MSPSRGPSRTREGVRCRRCFMRTELCLCPMIEKLTTRTRLVVIAHFLELKSTTNTGRIAHLALENSVLCSRGLRGQTLAEDVVLPQGYHHLVLYPSAEATPLTPEYIAKLTDPINLIVPDGTWHQAVRIPRREPLLRDLPRIKLVDPAPSRYLLRKSPRLEALSTFEAIIAALRLLEGNTIASRLDHIFETMVDRTLKSRGEDPRRNRPTD